MANQEHNNQSPHPSQSGTDPMNTKRDVAQSPDEKTDQDFPGYPHYPANEDMMGKSTGSHRVDAKLEEELGTGTNDSGVSQRFGTGQGNERAGIEPLQQDAAGAASSIEGNDAERGLPQNVSNEDLPPEQTSNDIAEASEKGSLNP